MREAYSASVELSGRRRTSASPRATTSASGARSSAAPASCSSLNNDVEVEPGFIGALRRGGRPSPRRRRALQQDPLRRPARPDLVRGRELRPALGLQRAPARLPRARRRALRRGRRDRPRLRRGDARPAAGARGGRPLRRGALPLQRGHRLVAARPRGRLPPLRRAGEPALAQGLGRARAARTRPTTLYYGISATRSRSASATRRSRGSAPGVAGASCSPRTLSQAALSEPQARGSRRRRSRAAATCARAASGSGGRPRMAV